MFFVAKFTPPSGWRKKWRRIFFTIPLIAIFPASAFALPSRLVLALDGVAYRDLKALQAGVTRTNFFGKTFQRRAFTADEGYFPVSRMVSTFPSASDVAWTDIFGNRPLPGYQRTYFCAAANAVISLNGVSSTMEHEAQMDWQVESGFVRAMGYLFPVHVYRLEMRGMVENFWQTASGRTNFYVYIRASDDGQHLDRDIFAMLCELDGKLQKLRADYQAKTGRDLQIVILSDHGHNHAGRGLRFEDRAFLEKNGYRITDTIANPKDIVLPTTGIESWVEIHNAPAETEKLAQLLCGLKGVDVLTAKIPNQTNQFLVMNSKRERAVIDWNPAKNLFRYSPESGDPLNYLPVIAALKKNLRLDADGFASADDWFAATMTNHYPLALERIVRGHTQDILNPATILISLDNRYVNDSWLVQQGSRLVTCGSTHGGLDDLCSDGILLSNFISTRDTSTGRVAGQFENFPAVKNYRATENGAEFVTKNEQALTRIARTPFDVEFKQLPDNEIFLRVWSPQLANDANVIIAAVIEKIPRFSRAQIRRSDPKPTEIFRRQIIFDAPVFAPGKNEGERIYALPPDLILEPHAEYEISGSIQASGKTIQLFAFNFFTGGDGRPAAF